METAYANQSAAYQYTRAKGTVNYDSATEAYTLTASPIAPWAIEKELDFSYPEPTSEMWHICDDMHFAHQTLHGDGSITAKIESIDPAHYGAQAGVMIRNTLDPTSPHVSIVATPLGKITFQYRTIELGATNSTQDAINSVELPHWVRLTREGNLFTAQHSSDGVNWLTVQDESSDRTSSVEISMSKTVHIGLAITSGGSIRSIKSRIAHVTITGLVTPDGPLTLSDDINLQKLSNLKD